MPKYDYPGQRQVGNPPAKYWSSHQNPQPRPDAGTLPTPDPRRRDVAEAGRNASWPGKPGFTTPVDVRDAAARDITAPPVRGEEPLTKDPHGAAAQMAMKPRVPRR